MVPVTIAYIGQIIDELCLKDFQIGEVQLTPFHGNNIANKEKSTVADICVLMNEVAAKAKSSKGFIFNL